MPVLSSLPTVMVRAVVYIPVCIRELVTFPLAWVLFWFLVSLHRIVPKGFEFSLAFRKSGTCSALNSSPWPQWQCVLCHLSVSLPLTCLRPWTPPFFLDKVLVDDLISSRKPVQCLGPRSPWLPLPWKLAVWHLRDEEGKLGTVGAKSLALNPQYLGSLK